jgi:hypothetical protein
MTDCNMYKGQRKSKSLPEQARSAVLTGMGCHLPLKEYSYRVCVCVYVCVVKKTPGPSESCVAPFAPHPTHTNTHTSMAMCKGIFFRHSYFWPGTELANGCHLIQSSSCMDGTTLPANRVETETRDSNYPSLQLPMSLILQARLFDGCLYSHCQTAEC